MSFLLCYLCFCLRYLNCAGCLQKLVLILLLHLRKVSKIAETNVVLFSLLAFFSLFWNFKILRLNNLTVWFKSRVFCLQEIKSSYSWGQRIKFYPRIQISFILCSPDTYMYYIFEWNYLITSFYYMNSPTSVSTALRKEIAN